jgi:hypothetical protein
MNLPRHAEIWLPGYLQSRFRQWSSRSSGPKRVWLAVADHFEPFGNGVDDTEAAGRVALWSREWPMIAARHRDSAGRPPRHTFFYPEEEYRPHLIEALAEMTKAGIADVEVHIHHDGEGERDFVDRVSGFQETLFYKHGLLRRHEGKIAFGFIHGNFALDNSLPGGRWCGLNNEITLLQELGCYADFTMPSGDSPTQAHTLNTIYWAVDDPARPKSYDFGMPLTASRPHNGLLMIPGPFGIRWHERLVPRLEKGEIASYDLPTRYRCRRWFDLAPRVGNDILIKLYTHGCQERHSAALLQGGGLDALFEAVQAECRIREWPFFFVSCWEMYQAVDAIAKQMDLEPLLAGEAELAVPHASLGCGQ